ncbi:MAG TPA: hypothetical protein VGS58_16570, partial [Candidatus Sulfopaludibacter sp.]|nr:hypothetical protein [Candidatus Sulfopaludibacter sp.]
QTVAVTLNVVGTLQLSTNSVSALTSGAVVTTEVDLLQGGTLPLQLQFPHGHPSWLSVEVIPQPSNPLLSGLLVTFNPQNVQPGQYPSGVTVASTLATQPVNLDITLTVVPLVTIDANVAGVSATIDNISYTLPHTFTWAPQSQHAISTTSPQGDSSVRYVFDHWSSGGAISQTITAPARFTDTSAWHASFNTWWALQATAVPGADGAILLNPQPTGGFYPDQTVVSVSAAPLVGFAFAGFSGDLSGTASPQNLKMDRARSISAAFVQAPVQVTIASSVPHLNVVIDGGAYTTPAVFVWGRYTSHTVVFQPVIAGATGVKYRFQSWNDTSAPPARVISVGASAATFTASFTTQYYLTASPSPADGGTVTGGGWHDAGTIAALSASAAQGFRFAGFSGDATGSTSPLNVAMDRAKTVAANFGPNGQPVIYAAPAGPDTDANGDHVVPIKLTNVGQGAAIGAQITSITNITVTSGSGQVTAAGLPVGVGDLAPGSSAAGNLLLQWPATATRIQMKVHFSANGGAYTGSTILNLFR